MGNTGYDITTERFFGAKATRVTGVATETQRELGRYSWRLLRVEMDERSELYQVLLDATDNGRAPADVLATAEGATAYVAHLAELGEVHGRIDRGPARPLGAEQSNTSLVVELGREPGLEPGDAAAAAGTSIVKVFRKLEEGLNPDVELLSRIDNPHVAAVTGYVTAAGRTLAMQQELVDGEDGFDLATTGRITPDDAFELGAAIRSVHESLAAEFGTETFAGAKLRHRLDRNLDEYLQRAGALRPYEARIRKIYARLGGADVEVQRVHGDLHLGQTLRSATRWRLIDFEGEPARPLEQRRLPDVSARDVAGMIRSFGYARAVGRLPEEWQNGCVDKLKLGYGELDPDLLAAYVADKAAYEVVYEANNRPDWVGIPLAALEHLCSE